MSTPSERDIARWSESLAAIARTGLAFTENRYERERFEEVLHVAAEMHGTTSLGFDRESRVEEWMAAVESGTAGYVTPKLAVGAIVGNDLGEVLLICRADAGMWLYPTGWCDVGYSAAEVAAKEVFEETGIHAEPLRLVAVIDGLRAGFTAIPLYSLVFHCRAVGGELNPHPLETTGAGWFSFDNLPSPLAGGAGWVDLAARTLANDHRETSFDPPRELPWAMPKG